MPKQRKHRLVIYVKSTRRAIGIVDRLWAVGELTDAQRGEKIRSILETQAEQDEKLKNKFAQIRQFYQKSVPDTRKGKTPC